MHTPVKTGTGSVHIETRGENVNSYIRSRTEKVHAVSIPESRPVMQIGAFSLKFNV